MTQQARRSISKSAAHGLALPGWAPTCLVWPAKVEADAFELPRPMLQQAISIFRLPDSKRPCTHLVRLGSLDALPCSWR